VQLLLLQQLHRARASPAGELQRQARAGRRPRRTASASLTHPASAGPVEAKGEEAIELALRQLESRCDDRRKQDRT